MDSMLCLPSQSDRQLIQLHSEKNVLCIITSTKVIDVAKNLLFLDVTALFPSVTGRALKLAGNGSLTLGFKSDGKIELEKPNFPNAKVLVEGIAQPSNSQQSLWLEVEGSYSGTERRTSPVRKCEDMSVDIILCQIH
ncbi:hypothetical protein TNCV_1273121 [Trichonephila clavipes]|nr:hypothetical protein TNCV_1273121 [Trichonephila clavipes]